MRSDQAMPETMVKGYKCARCGYEWVARKKGKEKPVRCPKCRSPYWHSEVRRPELSKAGKKRWQK